MALFPEGFVEQRLWLDPIEPDPSTYFGAVLRAEEIRRYVKEFELLIDPSDFTPKDLKGASYTMSPHPSEGWIIGSEGEHERLDVRENSRGRYYVVPRNSLVYIRLRETLRLPFYLIGRHNLKIDYVYQGLLLGTGPQVDPGYVGQIYIPLHNLTNQQVEIYIDESFVSIDFVRTGPLRLEKGVPDSYVKFYELYKDLKRPIDLEKVTKKTDLPTYLAGNRPSSSLGHLVSRLEGIDKAVESHFKEIETDVESRVGRLETELRSRKFLEAGVVLTVLGLLCGFFFYFNSQLAAKKDATVKAIADLQSEFASLRVQVADAQSQARSQSDDKQVAAIRDDIEKLKTEIGSLKANVEADQRTRAAASPAKR